MHSDNKGNKQTTDIFSLITKQLQQLTKGQVTCLDAKKALNRYGANTMAISRSIGGAFIVRQISADHGQAVEMANIGHIVTAANAYGTPLQIISSGQNWGYGTAMPTDDSRAHFILDLSELKRIELNEQLGIVWLQPGVTQQNLRDYLDTCNAALMVPVTGAGPSCSIVGNALERGYGITPHADHFAAVTSIQAVLADGSHYSSAIASLDLTKQNIVDMSYKWGLGPYLDGIFTQSNLGIVTSMSIRLAHEPEVVESFYLFCAEESDLERVFPLVQQLLRDFAGVVGSINILDSRRMLSMMVTNADGLSLCSQTDVDRLKQEYKVSQWTCIGSLYGSARVVKAVKKEIKRKLKGNTAVKRSLFISAREIAIANQFIDLLPDRVLTGPRRQLATLEKTTQIMRGIPNEVALPLAYWRNPDKPKQLQMLNPAKDNCGLLWYAPLIPATEDKIREFVDMVRTICLKFDIEPLITLTTLRHDCIDSTVPLLFNRADPAAIKAAKLCLDELFDSGCKLGFVPYRVNVEQQRRLLSAEEPHWSVVDKIKKALDPNNIIAPGRYNP